MIQMAGRGWILFLLGLVAVVWADPLFTGRNFAGRDLIAYNYPVERTSHAAYARGELPLWFPEVAGGRPFLPNPNTGSLYPLRPLLSLFSFPTAVRLYPILHWALAGAGMLLLLSRLGVSAAGRWAGALTYVFSGVLVSEVFLFPALAGTALLPWIVWSFAGCRRVLSGATARTGLLVGLDLLAGDVFTLALALLAMLLWIGLESGRGKKRRGLAVFALTLVLGFLLAAPQIVATGLWAARTARAISGIRLGEALDLSLSPWRLIELLVPFPFGATWSLEYGRVWAPGVFRFRPAGLHATIYAGAFALAAVGICWRDRSPGSRFARWLLGASLALAVLPVLAPEAWAAVKSPVALRNPEKFAVGIAFALALLSGMAIDRAAGRLRTARLALAVAGVLAVLSAGVAALGPAHRPVLRAELPEALAEGAAFWLATSGALYLLDGGGRMAMAGALMLLTAVPIAANRRIALVQRQEEIFAPTAFARMVRRRDPRREYRTLAESLYRPPSAIERAVTESEPTFTAAPRRRWIEYTPAIWGGETVFNDDFDRGDLARMEWLRRVSFPAARHASGRNFFSVLSLRWGIRYRDQPPLTGFERVGGDGLQDWDENAAALPDIRLLERWREEASGIDALNTLSRAGAGEVVIETGRRSVGSARSGRVRILERSPSRLRVSCDAPEPTWLFVLREFWPFREIQVDGRTVAPAMAQIAFTAVPVPAGRHQVEWRERLAGGSASRWGPVLFAAGSVALAWAGRRRAAEPA